MLQKLSLYHFKNYEAKIFHFDFRINCFWGKNGVGKTNILDAVYYLCFTKSYFTSQDNRIITKGEEGMFIHGFFDREEVKCIIRENGKKEVLYNSEAYNKFSDHIGKFPAVMISPDDTSLINEHSDVRRRFFDMILSQIDHDYLHHLIHYNKYLAQRNALLKLQDQQLTDATLLLTYNEGLILHGTEIHNKRKDFFEELRKEIIINYQSISQARENISLHYQSSLEKKSFAQLLNEHKERDFFMQRTTAGIHRDDLIFELEGLPFKQHASQGQRKTFLFALKLAEFSLLRKHLNKSPILLIDDMFEKLDVHRAQHLVHYIEDLNTQVFITDTDENRLKNAFRLKDIGYIQIN